MRANEHVCVFVELGALPEVSMQSRHQVYWDPSSMKYYGLDIVFSCGAVPLIASSESAVFAWVMGSTTGCGQHVFVNISSLTGQQAWLVQGAEEAFRGRCWNGNDSPGASSANLLRRVVPIRVSCSTRRRTSMCHFAQSWLCGSSG